MKRIFLVLLSFICLFSAYSKQHKNNNSKTNVPFYIEQSFESYGKDPGASPDVVRQRLEALHTQVELRYSADVQSHIDRYMKNGRRNVATIQVLSSYYLPIFEKALAEAGLPDELKYIPIIESGLDAKATSYAGAGGLWQIMPATARGYDMRVNSTIDERRDPYIASERACRMLKKSYEKFGDWTLALAAYNCGSGTLQKALKRAGGDSSKHNFWTICQYLPAQTRQYIPKFIAMVYIMNYYTEHDIPEVKIAQPYKADTIRVSEKLALSKMAKMLDVSVADLKALNPHFTSDVIPASASRPCNVILPASAALAYRVEQGRAPQGGEYMADAEPKANVDSNENRPQKASETEYAYYDEPSTIFPGTYVRKARTEQSVSSRRKRSSSKNKNEQEGTRASASSL